MGATILKAPILLFVADEKKYGNTYITRWKYQWRRYWEETKSDYSVIKDGNRSKLKQEDKPLSVVGTWKELDAMRPGVEKELEEGPSKSSESIDQSRKLGRNLKEKSQNASNEQINKNQERGTSHAKGVKEKRNSQPPGMNTPSRP
ncbi:hypothetical protein [Wolbachia endosymbiont of Ctenocephalides felis wCfeJ]|uniref:hypothetical protein n=1 Tax=Wolbachia endosymbiont of Ctenocephalides felis wCfeJ TaxID=2732594 RepID=UPI00350F0139